MFTHASFFYNTPLLGSGDGTKHVLVKPPILLLLIVILVSLSACNSKHYRPTVLNLPHHYIFPGISPGTVIYTRLTNTTDHSITLHPLLAPMNATDSASLIQGILSQITQTGNIDNIRLQLLRVVGRYIKSPLKVSFLPNFKDGNDDSIINRAYSLIGNSFSVPSWHCDNFCKEAIYMLECTKYFADSDFIIENCHIHTTMQVKLLGGDTVFTDMAVNTPVFMVANTAKKCGWASLNDILNNSGLVTPKSYYANARKAGSGKIGKNPAKLIIDSPIFLRQPTGDLARKS